MAAAAAAAAARRRAAAAAAAAEAEATVPLANTVPVRGEAAGEVRIHSQAFSISLGTGAFQFLIVRTAQFQELFVLWFLKNPPIWVCWMLTSPWTLFGKGRSQVFAVQPFP